MTDKGAQLPDPVLGERFGRALLLGVELHASQPRKGNTLPYLGHVLGVASLVIDDGGSEDEIIAALLHDGPEDQGGETTLERIRAEFGDGVAGIVAECSDTFEDPKPPWRERKEAYLKHLETASDGALRVSLADKLHNARAILADYRVLGEDLWHRFAGKRDGTIWYYAALSATFARRRPGAMAEELARTVSEIKRLAGAT